MKLLQAVIKNIEIESTLGDLAVEITGVTYDSRKVQPGSLFVCIEGFTTDGHKYIFQAMEKGAAAIVIQKDLPIPEQVAVIRVKNSRLALAQAAANFFDNPADSINVIGVTGTNGKTTTTYLLSDVLEYIGDKTGVIGTIHNRIGDEVFPSEHTTPESSDLQLLLSQMKSAGVNDVAMEVSSHALSLERIATIKFSGAIFTNLTQDHLDFHESMAHYFTAKSSLFTFYQHNNRINIINIDDSYGKELISLAIGKNISYGITNNKADFRATDIKLLPNGLSYKVRYSGGELELKLKLLGEFNVYNSLAVVAYALSCGINPVKVKEAMEKASGVPGRFQIIEAGQPFSVAVDYAHTPDGLENILASARKFVSGRILTIFGCGGDRDRTKRPKMGEIAARLSDELFITSDNPRSEEPSAIITDIIAGIPAKPIAVVISEVDRRKAIELAFSKAKPGDMVIIAGKGHEDYQIMKDKTLHFDDCEVARELLRGLKYEN